MKKLLTILMVVASLIFAPPLLAQATDEVGKSMQIPYEEGQLSGLTFRIGNEAFTKIFSAITVSDVTNFWNDIIVLHRKTDIRILNVFINSPGGDAFSGLALADKIIMAKNLGFTVNAYASGIVASAAVPVLAVCDRRIAGKGTIFMVHETSIWKWPGRETASDIRSQTKLMELIRSHFLDKLAKHTKLSAEDWGKLEFETTWFGANEAKEYGLIDEIE